MVGIGVLIASTLGFGWGSNAELLDASRFVQGVGGAVAWAGALAWLTSTTCPCWSPATSPAPLESTYRTLPA